MNSGIVGEYFVIAELLRLGYEVFVSPDPKNEDWDIVVHKNIGGHSQNVKIQVKAIDWAKTNRTIQGNYTGDYDLLVVVMINFYRTQPYAVYVIPKSEIKQRPASQPQGLMCRNSGKLLYTRRTITFTTFKKKSVRGLINRRYRNSWWRI
jgi:hypothetical protein